MSCEYSINLLKDRTNLKDYYQIVSTFNFVLGVIGTKLNEMTNKKCKYEM